MLDVQTKDGALRVKVRVKPRASASRVLGVREGALEVSVAAPPTDGRANRELERVLARHFGLPPSAVRVVLGDTGRVKLVSLSGINRDELGARLSPRPPGR